MSNWVWIEFAWTQNEVVWNPRIVIPKPLQDSPSPVHLNLWLFLCASVVIAQEAVSEKQSPLYTVLEKCIRFLVAMDIIDEQTTLFVFQYLEVAELLMAGIVSKYWFNLSSMVRVWYWIFHHDKYLTILILIENFNRHRTSFGTHCGKVLTLYPQYSQLKLEAKKCLIW